MLLRELFEGGSKHVTFCFGRMNPPTIGHEQVFKTMESQGGDYFIFVSQSQDKKENPLSYSEKIKFIKAIHEKYADHVVEDSSINTVVKAASYLYDQGYTDATFVAGSDRIEQFKKLLTQYNGVEGKAHGYYKFNVLDFVSSGEREDGAEGVAGVSASGARLAAANNDLEAFTKATGAGQYAKPMFDAVRQGMGVKETIDQISELAGEEDYYKFILGKLKLGRPLTKREQEFLKTYRLMHKTEDIDMRASEILEHKKSRRAKTYNVKPRNPVAHAAQTTVSGAGAHRDKKKEQKQGYEKHKGKDVDESIVSELSPNTLANYKKKAGADASAADKAGDFKRGNKRFSGVIRATKKEFDNDKKGIKEAWEEIPKGSYNDWDLYAYDPETMELKRTWGPKERSGQFHAQDAKEAGWEIRKGSDFNYGKVEPLKREAKVSERIRDPEDWDEGNTEPPNNMAIYINGKKWKVFPGRGTYADDAREMKQYYDLQAWARKKSEATGKKWEVYRTGEPATP